MRGRKHSTQPLSERFVCNAAVPLVTLSAQQALAAPVERVAASPAAYKALCRNSSTPGHVTGGAKIACRTYFASKGC
eukprot:6341656-Amphidinium_carterae.1